MDDEGWQGDAWDSEIPETPVGPQGAEPSAAVPPPPPPPGAPIPPPPPVGGSSSSGWQPSGPPTSAIPATAGGSGGLSRNAIIAIAVAAVVIIGGVVGAVAASSGGKHHVATSPTSVTKGAPSPTTGATPTSSPTTTPSTPSSSATTIANTSLLSNSPFNTCAEVPAADRPIPELTDEIACTGSDVSNEGGAAVFYAQFSSVSFAQAYVSLLVHGAAVAGNCSGITPSTGAASAFCSFQDSSQLSGDAILYIGENFIFSTTEASTESNCTSLGQSSTSGTAVVLWNYSGSPVVGGIFSCSADSSALASMRSGLLAGDYELNNQ